MGFHINPDAYRLNRRGSENQAGESLKTHRFLAAAYLSFTILAALLCVLAGKYAYFPGDIYVSQAVQSLQSPLLDTSMRAVSLMGQRLQASLIVLAGTLGIWLLGYKLEALATLGVFGGDVLAVVLKHFISRPRPTSGLVTVLANMDDTGFPSGHALHFVVFYGFLFFLAWTLMRPSIARLGVLILTGSLIGMVGISRVYLGAHWASDVAGGYLIGGLWLAAQIHAYEYLKHRGWPTGTGRF